MSAQHTPTPWTLNHDDILATDDPKDVIAMCQHDYDGMAEENAEFIVRACNAHDDLVRTLTGLLERYKQAIGNEGIECYAARAVLAKAGAA